MFDASSFFKCVKYQFYCNVNVGLKNNSVIWRDVGYNTTMPFFIERDIQYTLNLTDFNKIIGFSKPRMARFVSGWNCLTMKKSYSISFLLILIPGSRGFRISLRTIQGCSYILVLHACSVLEYLHAGVHNYVGGNMAELMSSSYDPLFFMHHAMVDHIWEQWRQLRQVWKKSAMCRHGLSC